MVKAKLSCAHYEGIYISEGMLPLMFNFGFKLSGQLLAPAALLPGNKTSVPIEQET